MRILIVDDEEVVRVTLQEILECAGHDVRTVEDGRFAVEACETYRPDVVLTDIIMPGQEGIETIYELKSRFPGLKIIAMSGGSRKGVGSYLPTAEAIGAELSLEKPFSRDALLSAISQVLRS